MNIKGKYTTELVELICKAIYNTGKDKDVIEAGGINKDTFYRWNKTKSDFSDSVARAKEQFRAKLWKKDPDLYTKAVDGLKIHINGYTEEWKTVIEHPDGKKTIKTTLVKRPPSKWAVQMILGKETEIKPSIEPINTDILREAMDVITKMDYTCRKAEEKRN